MLAMLEKVKCSKCEHSYDKTFDSCPKCREANLEQPEGFKELTMLKYGKQIALFLTGWLGFQILGLFFSLLLAPHYEGLEYSEYISSMFNIELNASTYLVLLAALLLICFEELPKLIKSFKNWQSYAAAALAVLAILLFNFFYGLFIDVVGPGMDVNQNEAGIKAISNSFPLLSFIIFGFVGPICEELTYRVGLFSFLKRINVYLAYGISLVVFALIHFNFAGENLVNELLNLPFYLFAGFTFAFIYDKFGLSSSLTAHVLNNVVSLSLFSLFRL